MFTRARNICVNGGTFTNHYDIENLHVRGLRGKSYSDTILSPSNAIAQVSSKHLLS